MSRYTYTLNPNRVGEENHTYKQSELEKMTTFHLREICRKESLVVSSAMNGDREGLIRLIMRFRGQREYRHIKTFCEGGLENIQSFLDQYGIRFSDIPEVNIPGTITLFEGTEMNEEVKRGEMELITPDEIVEEMELFLSHIDSPGTIFRTNHASNYVVLAGTFNEDIPDMMKQLERAKAEQRYRLEEWRRHI